MVTNPLISVCVPVYNQGRFLSDCIESVQEQTLADWELVICDDCSTDETAEVAQRYAAKDPRIRYMRNDQRLGMSANLKRAADLGTGKYLKILCSDDWLTPRCLEVLSGLMEKHPGVVLATSAEVYSDEVGTPLQVQFLFGERISIISGDVMLDRMARGSGFGGNSSFMISTSAYHEIGGFDSNLRYAGDYDLAARLCRSGNYLHTDEPLFYGRSHSESSTAQNPKLLLDVLDSFEIPGKIYQPRRFLNRDWRRYQMLTALLTARYLLNIALQYLRGNRSYATKLRDTILEHGNLLLGIPFLAVHIPIRLYNRLTGKHRPISRPAEPWMISPSARRGAIN